MYTTKSLQRGFTEKSAPLNAAFILEEARRESWDENNPFIIVTLDAKSAFDVVVHKNLLRKLYHIGIDDNHWTIINSMHTNAKTSIKWKGYISESFNIEQGYVKVIYRVQTYTRFMWTHYYTG